MRRPHLPAPQRRRTLALTLPLFLLTFSGCASSPPPAATASAPTPAATVTVANGSSAPAAPPPPPRPVTASDVLTSGRAPFDACYTMARKTNPNLPRTSVEISFSMDDDGKLQHVDFVYRNRMDDAAKDCMRSAAEKLTFPASLHGMQVATIVFSPPAGP